MRLNFFVQAYFYISQCVKKFDQILEATRRGVGAFALADEKVGQKEGVHANALRRADVLLGVVADHEATGGIQVHFLRDLRIIGGIRLAEGRIFVGRDEIKAFGSDLCP